MEVFNSLVLFGIGFFILTKGAQILIRGSVSIARLFDVSSWFIGMVLVGIGTSIPELSISIASVFNGNTIGLTAIIGSNTFNILVILGFSALFAPLLLHREWIVKDLPINILAVLVASGMIIFPLLGPEGFSGISRSEGVVLLGLLIAWLIYMYQRRHTLDDDRDYQVVSILASVVMIIAGVIGVFVGGRWVVGGAETIALALGVSPALVGLTIVAIGTSIPELAVSIAAVFRRETSIAVGNVIGSNIFDFFGILGITALIRPMPVLERLQFDIFATLGATVLLFVAALFLGKRLMLSRPEGLLFILAYIGYVGFLLWRG